MLINILIHFQFRGGGIYPRSIYGFIACSTSLSNVHILQYIPIHYAIGLPEWDKNLYPTFLYIPDNEHAGDSIMTAGR